MAATRKHARLAIGRGIELADQPIAVQDRQREVAPAALRRRLVHLERCTRSRRGPRAVAVEDERSNGDSSAVRGSKLGASSGAGSTRQAPSTPSTTASSRRRRRRSARPAARRLRAGDARARRADARRAARCASSAVSSATSGGYTRSARSHSRSLPSRPRNGDLAAHRQDLEHLRDVAVVRPARRWPRAPGSCRGSRSCAAVRPRAAAPARPGGIGRWPRATRGCRAYGGRGAHDRQVERQIGHGPIEARPLEDRAVDLDRAGEVGRLVRPADPAPQDQVGAGSDGRRRIDVDDGQAVDRLDDAGRPVGRQQLRADGDAARLVAVQPDRPCVER